MDSVQKYHEYGADKADTYNDRFPPTKYEDRYQATYTRPPPTQGPPTPKPSRLPPSKYDEIIPYRPYAPQDTRPVSNPYKPPSKDPYFEDVGVGPPPNDYSYENDNIDKVSQSYHPDGPDYSTGTTVLNPFGSKGSVPFKVGLDLYPMVTGTSLSALGKQDIYSLPSSPGYDGDNNKHEIMLHLNLFSKKPSVLGGREQDIEIGPFTLSG